MNTLHVVQVLSIGGIERLVLSMLNASFNNTYVFILQHSKEQSIQNWPFIGNYQDHLFFSDLESSGKKNTVRNLRQLCIKLKITTIHSHYTGPLLYASLATIGLKQITHVHTQHDVWHLSSWKYRIIEKCLLKLNRQIKLVAVSKEIQQGLKRYFPNEKPILIYNGINTNTFMPGNKEAACQYFNISSDPIIIGSAGSLIPIKGHQYLIKAMVELPEHFHLIIAGGGALQQELITLIKQLKIEHRVHLLGSVENMSMFYQACDLFCHPSTDEGLPLVLLEAQSANLPTVCSNVGGCHEVIDPHSGLLVQPRDPHAIALACINLYEKKGQPREFIVNHFSLDALMHNYEQLYKRNYSHVNSN